ncbi:MAG: type II secretion system protein [bacterium]|nr:type II secretion system protein [bacterium]
MIKFFHRDKEGFTLVELLIVISIISLLASTVLASLNSARAKAVVAAQIQIVEEYKKVLDLYYSDNGQYFHLPPINQPPFYGVACMGDYATDQCEYSATRLENPALNTALEKYLSSRTPLKQVYSSIFNRNYDGPIYVCNDMSCSFFSMVWFMPGDNQRCGLGVTGSNMGGTTFCGFIFQ